MPHPRLRTLLWKIRRPVRPRFSTTLFSIILIALFLPAMVGGVQAQNVRYVDPVGTDDAGDCRVATAPCGSIAYAIAVSDSGDTIEVADGIYTEKNIVVDRDVVLRGQGPDRTIVQAQEEQPSYTASSHQAAASTRDRESVSAELEHIRQDLAHGRLGVEKALRVQEAVLMQRFQNSRQASKRSASVGGVFTVSAGVSATLEGLAIRHGCADEQYPDGSGVFNEGALTLRNTVVSDNGAYFTECGGGIYSRGALTIVESTIRDNFSYWHNGAGINNDGGTLTITNSTVTRNTGDHNPSCGGIRSDGAAMITDTEISENGQGDGSGGGICSLGSMMLVRSTVRDNYAQWGLGGAVLASGELHIVETTIAGNWSKYLAGGILSDGMLRIENSTIRDNWSPSDEIEAVGSGLAVTGGDALLINTTVSGNSGSGGAIGIGYVEDAAVLRLVSSTVADNASGGIYVAGDDIPGERRVEVKNTIIAGNVGPDGATDCDGVLHSHGFNLIGDPMGCTIEQVADGTADIYGIDPGLGPLQDNGGPTLTHALDIESPAYDNGTCYGFDGELLDADQRSSIRTTPCDIGAFELKATTGGAENGATGTSSDAADRAAIETFSLSQNYPNPFNPSTVIAFALPRSGHVELVVYDVTGRAVARLVDATLGAGRHRIEFEAGNLPSGVYVYRMESGPYSETRRMLLVK